MSAQALRLSPRRGSDASRRDDAEPDTLPDDAAYDLLAGLWQESPFARLPADAPPELKPFIRDIDNPRRVYAIHRAARRHDFQLLVQVYIRQLRDGCGVATCTTPTCFSCRKRLAGKAPIRRYNPTSARTLAIYLASQDHPERGICPTLKQSTDVTPAVNNLVFTKCRIEKDATSRTLDDNVPAQKRAAAQPEAEPRAGETVEEKPAYDSLSNILAKAPTEICMSERPVTRDHRSFAATTFGTVAFKMLEWLAPNSLDTLSQRISVLESPLKTDTESKPAVSPEPERKATSAGDRREPAATAVAKPIQKPSLNPDSSGADLRSRKEQHTSKRNSKPTFRPMPSVETTRRKSIEPVCVTAENDNNGLHRTTRVNGYHPDKLSRRTKSPTTITFKPAFFENVPIPPPSADDVTVTSSDGEESTKESTSKPTLHDTKHSQRHSEHSTDYIQDEGHEDAESETCPLPQSFSQLNVEIINFICDVYSEDRTSEAQFFGMPDVGQGYPKPKNDRRPFSRKSQRRDAICKRDWKAFHEQTLFNIMSDPAALVSSFTRNGKFFDSHSLWYCMVRLTRASPSLVLHSLWMSAASLFSLPDGQKDNRKARRKSTQQAEAVMSICLHALVALVPVVPDSKTLYDLSRIRSHGLALANSSASYRRSSSLCLEYDDVFSNSLALRLARRLFLAITVRQQNQKPSEDGADISGVLRLLLEQLDLRNTSAERILEFAQDERLLHETRVPTLLLDWTRAVLLHEWDGNAQFHKDGTFYGALSFMDTLCEYYSSSVPLLLANPA